MGLEMATSKQWYSNKLFIGKQVSARRLCFNTRAQEEPKTTHRQSVETVAVWPLNASFYARTRQ